MFDMLRRWPVFVPDVAEEIPAELPAEEKTDQPVSEETKPVVDATENHPPNPEV
jgi:hypothetical protein